MQYSFLLYSPEAGDVEVSEDQMAWGRAAFDAYATEFDAAGVLVSAGMLQAVAASTTVSVRDGARTVHDGPLAAAAAEQLSGTFVITAPDIDAAIEWSAKCPGAQYGSVQIRPASMTFHDGAWHGQD
jgi:hypothetical protein